MPEVSFDVPKELLPVISKIAKRARKLGFDRDQVSIMMDLEATHANGCPMDFGRLLEADDFNLLHDVGGIARHLNRETGELEDYFLPRFRDRDAPVKRTEIDFLATKPGNPTQPYTLELRGHVNREDMPEAIAARGYGFVRLLAVRRMETGKADIYE